MDRHWLGLGLGAVLTLTATNAATFMAVDGAIQRGTNVRDVREALGPRPELLGPGYYLINAPGEHAAYAVNHVRNQLE